MRCPRPRLHCHLLFDFEEHERLSTHHEHVGGRGRTIAEAHLRLETTPAVIAASIFGACAIGAALALSPILAPILICLVIFLAAAARFGVLGPTVILTGTLPWLIALSDLLPRLTVTVSAAATAAFMALVAVPRSDGSRASFRLRLGLVLYAVPVVVSMALNASGAGFIQAAKLVIFPLMVVVVTEGTNRRDLALLRRVAYWSSAAAVAMTLLIGFSGIANISKYQAGDVLGYASAHTLALLAGCVFAASLESSASITLTAYLVAGVGAIGAVATGVRSVLPGLLLVALTRMFIGRARFRVIVLVAVAVIAVFVSGAARVVENRFHRSQQVGEFNSLGNLGSGRGDIYATAIKGWWDASPPHWIVGTGLRSIGAFEEKRLGSDFVGHSDIVEIGVQLGIVGLIGLIILWWVLIDRAGSRMPLYILGSFALFNGVLEYSAAVVIAMILTAPPRLRDTATSPDLSADDLTRDAGLRIRRY